MTENFELTSTEALPPIELPAGSHTPEIVEAAPFRPEDLFGGKPCADMAAKSETSSWQKYCDGRLRQFAAFR